MLACVFLSGDGADDVRVSGVDDWWSNDAVVTCFDFATFNICMRFVERVCVEWCVVQM